MEVHTDSIHAENYWAKSGLANTKSVENNTTAPTYKVHCGAKAGPIAPVALSIPENQTPRIRVITPCRQSAKNASSQGKHGVTRVIDMAIAVKRSQPQPTCGQLPHQTSLRTSKTNGAARPSVVVLALYPLFAKVNTSIANAKLQSQSKKVPILENEKIAHSRPYERPSKSTPKYFPTTTGIGLGCFAEESSTASAVMSGSAGSITADSVLCTLGESEDGETCSTF